MRLLSPLGVIVLVCHSSASLWLPFANFDSMIGTLKEVTLKEGMEQPENALSIALLAHAGRELFSNMGRFFSSSISSEDTMNIAHGLRELFNVTTTAAPIITLVFTPRIIPVTEASSTVKFTFPYATWTMPRTTPRPTTRTFTRITQPPTPRPYTFPEYTPRPYTRPPPIMTTTTSTSTVPPTKATYTTTTTRRTTTTRPLTTTSTTTTTTTAASLPPTSTVYPIWPTTPRRGLVWKRVHPTVSTTPDRIGDSSEEEEEDVEEYGTFPYEVTTKSNIPEIIKFRTRKPGPTRTTTSLPPVDVATTSEVCKPGSRCSLRLRSFETSDPVFQYAYSHSTMIDDSMQNLLRDTQMTTFPSPLSWHDSVSPEVLQMAQTIMTLYRPSRCLVIGVFTGLGLLGIAEHVDSRGIVVALEHPEYSQFWEKVGLKHAKKMTHSHISRIQVRSAESIEKALPRLAISEPNTFDFVFLDDFKRSNYLDDYEHSVRLLRSGGLLIINQALNGGGVLSGVDNMTNEDKVLRDMNLRIRQDGRVRASLLPFSGGTWLISKK